MKTVVGIIGVIVAAAASWVAIDAVARNKKCGTAPYFDGNNVVEVPLVKEKGQCVCPAGTPNAGNPPAPNCGGIG